jgi:hypothetical protein
MDRRDRAYRIAHGLVLIGFAAWLCGNAYEEVVVVPNLASGDPVPLHAFRALFHATDPTTYYAIVGPITALGWIGSVIAARGAHRRTMLLAAAWVAPAVLVTVYVVVHVNLRLFFGAAPDTTTAHRLALEWLIWNAARIALVVVAFIVARRATRS